MTAPDPLSPIPNHGLEAERKPKMARAIAFLRDGKWLTLGRARAYATIMIGISVATIGWALSGPGLDDPAGRPVGTDFVSFWTVSWALLNGHLNAIYDPTALAALEQTVAPRSAAAFYAWQYPPIALLIVYPLALLPYLCALGVWLVAGACCYLSAIWRIFPRPLALWIALGFPAVLLTITHGQNAFLSAGLLAWGLLLLPDRPIAAGILVGVLSFKPQLAVLVPIAFVAGGYWRALIAVSLTVLALSAATILFFGIDIWRDFLASTEFAQQMLDTGSVSYFKLQSVFSAIRLAGGNLMLAYAGQGIAAVAAAIVVAWVWRSPSDSDTKAIALLAAIPLATPFLLDYDLMLLAPAIALMVRKQSREGALPWEATVLVAAAALPLLARPVAEYTGLALAPLTATALLAVVAVRCWRSLRRDDWQTDAGALPAGFPRKP